MVVIELFGGPADGQRYETEQCPSAIEVPVWEPHHAMPWLTPAGLPVPTRRAIYKLTAQVHFEAEGSQWVRRARFAYEKLG